MMLRNPWSRRNAPTIICRYDKKFSSQRLSRAARWACGLMRMGMIGISIPWDSRLSLWQFDMQHNAWSKLPVGLPRVSLPGYNCRSGVGRPDGSPFRSCFDKLGSVY